MAVANLHITALLKKHYPQVAEIYREGLATGIASFETSVPEWAGWDSKFLDSCRRIALLDDTVVGWCALSPISKREVYNGVAESTVYVSGEAQGKGIGKALLERLIADSEQAGFWMLQASIFAQNEASIQLHKSCGFRVVGRRAHIAQRDGRWHDNILMEKRTPMKNVLVLCTGNSCRSQMAEGYLKKFANNTANIYSAGIETHGLNPGAVATMAKDGIDITGHTSNHVDEYEGIAWDYIITVCDHAYENCPYIPAPNAKRMHHNFYDPSKFQGTPQETEAAFAKARDEIKEYCRSFIEANL